MSTHTHMAYTELEQFIGRGEEKVFWLVSQKNVLGLFLGWMIGQRLGQLLFGDGSLVPLCGAVGAILGVAVTFQYHGLLIARRLTIAARFYLRRAFRSPPIDAETLFPPVPPPAPSISVFRYDGTPVIVEQGDLL